MDLNFPKTFLVMATLNLYLSFQMTPGLLTNGAQGADRVTD